MDAAGSAVVGLGGDPWVFDSQRAWSPDGAWLAITRMVERQSIYVMNPFDGSIVWSTLPSDPECAVHSDPVWSADSRNVAFAENNWCHPEPETGVRVVRVNGLPMETNGLRIAGGFDPSWRR
jgi:Tol biopolymer transport system component